MKVKLPCGKFTEIDEQDAYLLKEFPHWRAPKGYVIITRYIKTEYGSVRQDVYLSRAIVKPSSRFVVDHKDRNPLNNKRSNLRMCSVNQNAVNKPKAKGKTSKYYGVSRCREAKTNVWRIFVRDPKTKNKRVTGCFSTEIEAAKAYDKIAFELWGEFAQLNFSK
jgi:hypothetical protein